MRVNLVEKGKDRSQSENVKTVPGGWWAELVERWILVIPENHTKGSIYENWTRDELCRL